MQLVDIKSRSKLPITINLRMKEYGATPALAGREMLRTVEMKDKKSGEVRSKNVAMKFPPAIRFPAGGTLTGLPAGVLDHPVIKSLLARRPGRRAKLLVSKQYDSDEAKTVPKKAKKASSARAKKTSRSSNK